MAGEYKKGTLLQEYFLNPHFKPTAEEKKELEPAVAEKIKEELMAKKAVTNETAVNVG